MTNQARTQELPPIGGGAATKPITTPPATSSLQIPEMKFTAQAKIRDGIASDSKQLIVVVDDCSGSMYGPKATEVDQANQGLGIELAKPDNKNGFIVGIVHFNQSAKLVAGPELATTITIPRIQAGGGTNFDAALNETLRVIRKFRDQPNPDGWDFQKPHVLILSDGQAPVSDNNIAALHEIADVTAIAYGADARAETLCRIASDGQVHVVGTNGGELRKFLAKVGQTLSAKLAATR